MRWKPSVDRGPMAGETRRRKAFALFPRECDDGTTVWMGSVIITDRFSYIPDWDTPRWDWQTESVVPA